MKESKVTEPRHRDADELQEVVYYRPILIKDTQSRLQQKTEGKMNGKTILYVAGINTMWLYKYFQE